LDGGRNRQVKKGGERKGELILGIFRGRKKDETSKMPKG